MKYFTLGPVEMYPYTLEKGKEQVPYFRTNEFSQVVLEVEEIVKRLAYCDEKDRALLLTASGTGAMEAVVINCLTKEDRVLVIDGGSFGHRFVELCNLHEIPHDVLRLEFGEALTKEKLEAYGSSNLTALLVNIHETSTGQLYDCGMLAEFCREHHMYFFVDAISSFLADPIRVKDSGIDALILSSQKGLALPPGLSIVLLSSRVIQERVEKSKTKSIYFDFKSALKDGVRGQTPFTPAVGIIYQLHERLQHIERESVENVIANTERLARNFRELIKDLPVRLPDYPLSNAATPLIMDHAYDAYTKLRYEYGITLTPNGGTLADTVVRVGHIGCHSMDDNKCLAEALHKILC